MHSTGGGGKGGADDFFWGGFLREKGAMVKISDEGRGLLIFF